MKNALGVSRHYQFRGAIALTVICVFAFMGCEKHKRVSNFVPIKVKALEAESITISTRFSGSVEPLQTTSLAFKLSGTVQRLYRPPGLERDVQVGDTLAKGTVIAELDEGDLRRSKMSAEAKVAQLEARVATARDTLEIATRNYQRYVGSAGAVSKSALDEADSRRISAAGELQAAEQMLADARVQLDQAVDNYENRQLIVPFDDATVAEKNIEPGERKAAHEVAFRLIDISTVHVNVGVPDTLVGKPELESSSLERVYLGQKLPVTADAFEGRTLEGVVTKIAPEADPKTRTFLVQLTLDNQEFGTHGFLLRPGMIVSVRVGAQHDRKVMLLPMTAIHQGASQNELMVYEAVSEKEAEKERQVARARKVSVGGVYNNQVEILPDGSQVQAGSKVIVTTAERLADGVVVRIMPEELGAAVLPEAR